jgi:hypothetical protein
MESAGGGELMAGAREAIGLGIRCIVVDTGVIVALLA